VQIAGTWNWLQINSTSSGIKTDGTLWVWGFNSNGACGQNNVITAISSPVQIGSDNTWVLSRNVYNNNVTMAIKGDGTLWGVGANAFGQLGDGTAVNRSSIVQSGTGAFWKDIQCGNQYTIGLKYNGTIWGVGINSSGQLGLGNLVSRSSWVQIGSSNDWAIISTSQNPTAAIKNDGTLWTWGNGGAGMALLTSLCRHKLGQEMTGAWFPLAKTS